MNLGQKIKNKRLQMKLTQEQLGEMIGVSKMSISKYENNIVDNMSKDKIYHLSNILDIPIIDFINDDISLEEIDELQFDTEVVNQAIKIVDAFLSDIEPEKKKELYKQIAWALNKKGGE